VPGTTPRILVCDDDEGIRGMLVAVLEAEGFEVACVGDGLACLAAIAADTPDILVLDVMMPGMDGYQVMEAIRAMPDFAALPIIAVTAKAMIGDRERAIASGASDYISKPVDIDQLLLLIAVWLYPAHA
jgi:CheY-like chemotaxis protein